jgi:uncharacterized Fe-S cluster-containing protein
MLFDLAFLNLLTLANSDETGFQSENWMPFKRYTDFGVIWIRLAGKLGQKYWSAGVVGILRWRIVVTQIVKEMVIIEGTLQVVEKAVTKLEEKVVLQSLPSGEVIITSEGEVVVSGVDPVRW